jgi:hypothetical protein
MNRDTSKGDNIAKMRANVKCSLGAHIRVREKPWEKINL